VTRSTDGVPARVHGNMSPILHNSLYVALYDCGLFILHFAHSHPKSTNRFIKAHDVKQHLAAFGTTLLLPLGP